MLSPTLSPDDQPWNRLLEENNRWYGRFLAYLALGPGRSVRAVYNQEKGHESSKQASPSWKDAAHRFEWERRAAAYDAWQHRGTLADKNTIDPAYAKRLADYATLLDRLHAHLTTELEAGSINDKVLAQYVAAMALYTRLKGAILSKESEAAHKEAEREREQEARPRVVFYMPEVLPLPIPQKTIVTEVDEPAS